MSPAFLELSGVIPARPAVQAPQLLVVRVLRVALTLLVVAQLARIPVLSNSVKDAPLLLNDLLVVAVVIAGALAVLRRQSLRFDLVAGFALAFAAVGGFSAVLAVPRFDLSGRQLAFSLAYLVRWLVYFAVYLTTANFIRRQDARAVWSALERAVLIFASFGIVQALFLPGFAQMLYPGTKAGLEWDYQGHRLVSTFLDPNFAGMFIVLGILVLLAQVSFGVRVGRWKLIVLFAALALTLSRSSVLAFLAGLLVILAVRGLSRRLLRAGGMLLLLLLPFLPLLLRFALSFNKLSIDQSALGRVIAWVRALSILAHNPVIGVGFDTYGFVQRHYGFRDFGNSAFGLDGGLLFIAVMTGAVGLLLYLSMLALALRNSRALWRAPEAASWERGIALGTAAVTVALVVHSTFLNSLLYPFLMEPLWVLWGLVTCIRSAGLAPGERQTQSAGRGNRIRGVDSGPAAQAGGTPPELRLGAL